MDHGKAEAISPVIHEYSQSSSQRISSINDAETQIGIDPMGFDPSLDEPSKVQERRERQGESLWYESFMPQLAAAPLISPQAHPK